MTEEIELETFITQALQNIKNSVGEDWALIKPIKFEVSVTKVVKAGAGAKIFVAKAEGEYSKENVSRITIEVNPRSKAHIRDRPSSKRIQGLGTPHDPNATTNY